MEKSVDTFAWTRKLECLSTICNDSVKKTLRSGLIGLLWDDLSDIIFDAERAKIIRKNILLHHLKSGTPNKVIGCMKNMSQLKLAKNDLRNQITTLEAEYEQQDYKVRQKVQKLRNVMSKRQEIRNRRDLLKLKNDQTSTQLRDCNDMKLVCRHLKPSTCKDLDPRVLIEISDIVTSLWTGANKRKVWDLVSSNLQHIEVPTLWFHLYQSLTQDVDTLIKSEAMQSINTDEKNINVGTAKIYGQHISMVSKRLLYSAKANNHQQNVLELIGSIEAASNNSADVSEWLALTLEVRKLETEQTSLQAEVDKIRDDLYENNTFAFDLAELTSDIQNIGGEIAEYVQNIQQSLNLLKCAPMFLMTTKEKTNLELQKIIEMRGNGYDSTVLNNDLTVELEIFHDVLDLNALRKVLLKGDIGVYRYINSCFNEASVSITNSQISNITSYFPLIQIPIYSLIECYQNLISISILKKFESLETEENTNIFQLPILAHEENNSNTIELLSLSKVVNMKTVAEIDKFTEILNAWVTQAVQKVMEIIEKTVDDATFLEWTERYELLLYMVHKSA